MKKTKLLLLNAFVKWKSGNISQYFRQRTNKLLSRLDVATRGHHPVTLHSWYYPQFKETNQRQLTLSNSVSSSRADVTKKFALSAIPSTQSEKLYLKEIPNEQTTGSRLSKYLRDVTSEKFYTGFGSMLEFTLKWEPDKMTWMPENGGTLWFKCFSLFASRDQKIYYKRENKIYFLLPHLKPHSSSVTILAGQLSHHF